jgi:hypothetical protein
MLETRADLEKELVDRLMTANNSATFPPDRITDLIQQSTIWAGSLYFWPPLMRARITTAAKNTQGLNYDYYDYPPDFLTKSISRIYIDGKKYMPKTFQTFLDYVDHSNSDQDKPDATKRYFSTYGRQYFIWPSYSGTAPVDNLLVWGNIQHPALNNASDKTIFSVWDDSGNEAIIKKGFAIAMKRLEPSLAVAEEQSALQLLALMWKRVTDEMQREQPLNSAMFNIPDMFGSGATMATIGNFNNVDVVW